MLIIFPRLDSLFTRYSLPATRYFLPSYHFKPFLGIKKIAKVLKTMAKRYVTYNQPNLSITI